MQTQPSPENKARAHLQKADSLVLWGSAVTDTTFAWIVIWVLVVCIEGYRYAYRLALFWPLLMGVIAPPPALVREEGASRFFGLAIAQPSPTATSSPFDIDRSVVVATQHDAA
jgi:hypothetical protein